jgi:predicted DNA-binding protein YlxM (UPF0122 family)
MVGVEVGERLKINRSAVSQCLEKGEEVLEKEGLNCLTI